MTPFCDPYTTCIAGSTTGSRGGNEDAEYPARPEERSVGDNKSPAPNHHQCVTALPSSSYQGVVKAVLKAAGAHLKVDDVIVEFE